MPKPDFSTAQSKFDEILRVNHAGEYGAMRIYEGQLRCMKNKIDYEIINDMLEQEKLHLLYFTDQLKQRKIRPTFLMPLWNIGGYALGICSGFMGIKQAMLVTESVEQVIETHYQDQLNYLQSTSEEAELAEAIKKFQTDEVEHKNIASLHNNQSSFFTRVISNSLKVFCKVAIYVSKKI